MNEKEYKKLIELVNIGGGFLPQNQNAIELLDQTQRGEVISLIEVTKRDLKFHRAYMSLLAYIYDYLPNSFKKKVAKDKFYVFLKHLKGNYEVLFEFKDGSKMIEYESISFGRMSQKTFESFVRDQLPFIYENVLGAFFEGDIYDAVVKNIEMEYEKFLAQL